MSTSPKFRGGGGRATLVVKISLFDHILYGLSYFVNSPSFYHNHVTSKSNNKIYDATYHSSLFIAPSLTTKASNMPSFLPES